MAGSDPTLGKYESWPPYPGYGEWTFTKLEDSQDVPGSDDNRIPSSLIPSNQFAVRYNPYSNEIPISDLTYNWSSALSLAHAGYTTGAQLSASYLRWLQNDEKYCAMFELVAGGSGASYFGPLPPTFDYSIGSTIKETVHYGIEAMFFCFVEISGVVWFITLDSFYAYPEYIARSKLKPFRLFKGDIQSVARLGDGSTTGTRLYSFTTNLLNDSTDKIDLSSSGVTLSLYKIKSDGSFDALDTSTITVKSIEGQVVIVEGPAPSDASKPYPDGWSGGFFVLNKYVIIQNPLLLHTDRKATAPYNITDNEYVVETDTGYETRAQQMERSGGVNGIYVTPESISSYLEQKVADPKSSAADITTYTADKAIVDGDTLPRLENENMIYGDLTTDFGKRLLGYVKQIGPSSVTLYIGIGGSSTRYHNMQAGCLSGAYIDHSVTSGTTTTVSTYRISNQLRRSIFQVDVRSRTSSGNLLDELYTDVTANPQVSYDVTVKICRCWFFNDITFTKDKSSLDQSMFWGHITSASTPSTTAQTSSLTLHVDSGWWIYGERQNLINRFTQSVTPASSNLVKAWPEQNGWRLNNYSGQSYKIISMTASTTDDQAYDIVIDGKYPSSVIPLDSKNWWISFDEKFTVSGGFNYISQPFFAMQGALGRTEQSSLRYNTLIVDGIYVGLPFQVPLPGDAVLSVCLETGGIYPSTTIQPPIYLSTARKGSTIHFCKNRYSDARVLCYTRPDDSAVHLMLRRGCMNYDYNVNEFFVYYGDYKCDSATVTGSTQNDLYIDMGVNAADNNIIGFSCKRASSANTPASTLTKGAYPFVVWQVYHGGYALGYPSTSGVVNNIYTRRFGTYAEEKSDTFYYYLPGEITSSSQKTRLFVPVNTRSPNKNVSSVSTLSLRPVYNSASSPMISDVKVFYVPHSNMVKNVTCPYIYSCQGTQNIVLYLRSPTWLVSESNSSNVTIGGSTLVKSGDITPASAFSTDIFDLKQDALYVVSTDNNFEIFNSGIFSRPASWQDPESAAPTDPGQPISDISVVNESNLYKFPFILAPNLSRCSYDTDEFVVNVVGFSKVKESSTSDNNITCLMFYSINIINTLRYPIYAIYGGSPSKNLFTYCHTGKYGKRILAQKPAYAATTDDNPAISLPDENLIIAPVTMASRKSTIIIVLHMKGGFVYFISSDYGESWSYFDDVNLVGNTSNSVSSPSIMLYDDNLWLTYLMNNTDLYIKIIPISQLMPLAFRTKGIKSSSVQDAGYINEKNTLQTFLNGPSCQNIYVAQINDQQVYFAMSNQRDLHIVYQSVEGWIKSFSSQNRGTTWNTAPVNF